MILQNIPCVPNLYFAPTFDSTYTVYLGDPALDIMLGDASNGNCEYTVLVEEIADDGSVIPMPTSVFTLTDAQFSIPSVYYPQHYQQDSNAILSVYSDSIEDVFNLRVTISDLAGVQILNSDLEVTVIKNNPCIEGFRNVPIDGQVYEYILGDPTKVIPFTGLDNTECAFDAEFYD